VSLTGSDPTHGEVVVTALGETCFYCDQPTSDPAITWHGATGAIWFHPACAVELCIRLNRDVLEWECRANARLVPKPTPINNRRTP